MSQARNGAEIGWNGSEGVEAATTAGYNVLAGVETEAAECINH